MTIHIMTDQNALINAVKTGEVNVAPLQARALRDQATEVGWTIATSGATVNGMMLLDRDGVLNPALADVRVRQAINVALDRRALTRAIQEDIGQPLTQPFPPTSSAHVPALEDAYPYDPEGAKALLAEAGYADGFTVDYLMRPQYRQDLELVSQQLADIGITVNLVDAGPAGFVGDIIAGKFPVIYVGMGDVSDWAVVTGYMAPTAVINPFDSQDDELDALTDVIRFATSDAERDEAWKAYNTRMVELAWFAPVLYVPDAVGTDANTEVVGWTPGRRLSPSLFSIQPKD